MKNSLFKRCDLHVHTHFSACGLDEMTPESIIQKAEKKGIEYLAITDHIHPHTGLSFLNLLREEFGRINTAVKVYIGCEADILSVGESVIGPELIAQTDFIMAAANHFPLPWVSKPEGGNRREIAQHFLDMFRYAAGLEHVDVIAHPLYVMPGSFEPTDPAELTEAELAPAVEIAAKNNVAIEISRRALSPGQTSFLLMFYRLCKEAGIKFAIGSDGHQLTDLAETLLVEPIIKELGLIDTDIWTPGSGC